MSKIILAYRSGLTQLFENTHRDPEDVIHRIVDPGFGRMDDLMHGVEFLSDQIIEKLSSITASHRYLFNDERRVQFFPGTLGYKNPTLRQEKLEFFSKAGSGIGILDQIDTDLTGVDRGYGLWVMKGAVVQPTTRIGTGCIIWPNVTISHGSLLGDYVWVSPNAAICGDCEIGNNVFIGAGSVIMPNTIIPDWSIIGAGAVVNGNFEHYGPGCVFYTGYNKRNVNCCGKEIRHKWSLK